MMCPEAKYIGETLDQDNCLNCLQTRVKCFHDKPQFNTVKIKAFLEKEADPRRWRNVIEAFGGVKLKET